MDELIEQLRKDFERGKKSALIAYGLGKWFVDDIRAYIYLSKPKWSREIRYFWPLIVQGKSISDVANMSNAEYAKFRESMPFIVKANPSFLRDYYEKQKKFKQSPLEEHKRVTIYTTHEAEEN